MNGQNWRLRLHEACRENRHDTWRWDAGIRCARGLGGYAHGHLCRRVVCWSDVPRDAHRVSCLAGRRAWAMWHYDWCGRGHGAAAGRCRERARAAETLRSGILSMERGEGRNSGHMGNVQPSACPAGSRAKACGRIDAAVESQCAPDRQRVDEYRLRAAGPWRQEAGVGQSAPTNLRTPPQ